MKRTKILAAILVLAIALSGCAAKKTEAEHTAAVQTDNGVAEIVLSDSAITVNGTPAGQDPTGDVYLANDIVYYEEGKDFTYGEGTQDDAHSAASAAEHTVVHIAKSGTYRISGVLSKGQIAVDLGDESKDDPEAVVTLILSGVDITCEVAPAVIFYNVYECGTKDTETASKDVDTSLAGANVIIADGTANTVSGSYVARIYSPDSVVLNEAETEVADAKKLHKYDAAFYSRMSMNINGESAGSGVLQINAENEGLDSELHLTVNGGIIRIRSGNDGINTNEDEASVTTLNGGEVHICVSGETGEGDGVDSNGWLVINGGTLVSQACASSMDSGIDSDMGIHIDGGTVIASGNMLDAIAQSSQNYLVLNFKEFPGAGTYCLKNADNKVVFEQQIDNDFTSLIFSSEDLTAGDHTLWYNGTQLVGAADEHGGMLAGERPQPPMGEMPENFDPEAMIPDREHVPSDFDPEKTPPEMNGMMPPDGFEGGRPEHHHGKMSMENMQRLEVFTVREGANYFYLVGIADQTG